MADVVITGHCKLYRDLYVSTNGHLEAMEDLGENDSRFSEKQQKVLNAFAMGDFEIKVSPEGKITVTLKGVVETRSNECCFEEGRKRGYHCVTKPCKVCPG
jgi:hypothetical protein